MFHVEQTKVFHVIALHIPQVPQVPQVLQVLQVPQVPRGTSAMQLLRVQVGVQT